MIFLSHTSTQLPSPFSASLKPCKQSPHVVFPEEQSCLLASKHASLAFTSQTSTMQQFVSASPKSVVASHTTAAHLLESSASAGGVHSPPVSSARHSCLGKHFPSSTMTKSCLHLLLVAGSEAIQLPRVPQSTQSLPNEQNELSAPSPPSSHDPSSAYTQRLLHSH